MKQPTRHFLSIFIVSICVFAGWFMYPGTQSWIKKHFDPAPAEKDENLLPRENKRLSRLVPYEDRLEKARKLIENHYYEKAEIELSQAIRQRQGSIEAYEIMAEIFFQTQSWDRLDALLGNIKNRFPKSHLGIFFRARKALVLEDWESFSTYATEEAITFIPDLLVYIAIAEAYEKDHENAKKILTDSLSLISKKYAKIASALLLVYDTFGQLSEGSSPHLLALIAKTLVAENEPALGEKFAHLSIKEKADYIDAWIVLGYAKYQQADLIEAQIAWEEAYRFDPLRSEAAYFLGLSLYDQGRELEAATYFEEALKGNLLFDNEIAMRLVEIFIAEKKYDQALAMYEKIASQNPPAQVIENGVRLALYTLKDPDAALKIIQKWQKNSDTDPKMEAFEIYALLLKDDLEVARQKLSVAQKKYINNPYLLLNEAFLAEKEGDVSSAKEGYKIVYISALAQKNSSLANLAADKHNGLKGR